MIGRIIIPIVLGAVVASMPALAADMTAAQKCTALESQFDKGIYPFHIASNPTTVKAKAMRDEGGQLCSSGKADEGAAKLRAALEVFGVTPQG